MPLPRPEGEGWELSADGTVWSRELTPEERKRFDEQAKLHGTEWVEKCDECNEPRDVVECLRCQQNCVACDADRPSYCVGNGCADDDAPKDATRAQREQVQHCVTCCSCVDWQKAKDEGRRVVAPECPGRELTIGQIDYSRLLVEVLPVDGDPDGLPVFRWVSFFDLSLDAVPTKAELEAAGQIRLLEPEVT